MLAQRSVHLRRYPLRQWWVLAGFRRAEQQPWAKKPSQPGEQALAGPVPVRLEEPQRARRLAEPVGSGPAPGGVPEWPQQAQVRPPSWAELWYQQQEEPQQRDVPV